MSGVACMSNKTGFDIAILAVSPKSRDMSATLPTALPLASKETVKQVKIAVIGYPAVNYPEGTEKTRELMKLLDDEAPNQSKFVAPGQVMLDEQKGEISRPHTYRGNARRKFRISGIFARSGRGYWHPLLLHGLVISVGIADRGFLAGLFVYQLCRHPLE